MRLHRIDKFVVYHQLPMDPDATDPLKEQIYLFRNGGGASGNGITGGDRNHKLNRIDTTNRRLKLVQIESTSDEDRELEYRVNALKEFIPVLQKFFKLSKDAIEIYEKQYLPSQFERLDPGIFQSANGDKNQKTQFIKARGSLHVKMEELMKLCTEEIIKKKDELIRKLLIKDFKSDHDEESPVLSESIPSIMSEQIDRCGFGPKFKPTLDRLISQITELYNLSNVLGSNEVNGNLLNGVKFKNLQSKYSTGLYFIVDMIGTLDPGGFMFDISKALKQVNEQEELTKKRKI